MTALDMVWVGFGGALGSLLRWFLGRFVAERHRGGFPLGTFLINVTGAFVVGYLATLFGVVWHDRYGSVLTAGVLTGFLGGYTTFSSMQLDAATLAKHARGEALAYLVASTLAGVGAAFLGIWLAWEAMP